MAIAIVKSWAPGEILTHTDLNAEFQNIVTQLPPIALQSEVSLMAETTKSLSPNHNKIILGTQVATTSGTAITFSSIPDGVRSTNIILSVFWTTVSSFVLISVVDV